MHHHRICVHVRTHAGRGTCRARISPAPPALYLNPICGRVCRPTITRFQRLGRARVAIDWTSEKNGPRAEVVQTIRALQTTKFHDFLIEPSSGTGFVKRVRRFETASRLDNGDHRGKPGVKINTSTVRVACAPTSTFFHDITHSRFSSRIPVLCLSPSLSRVHTHAHARVIPLLFSTRQKNRLR